MINDLMNLVGVEKDGAGHDFLEWFCREQVEEEAAAQLIVSQLKLVGDGGRTLHVSTSNLAQRKAKIVLTLSCKDEEQFQCVTW